MTSPVSSRAGLSDRLSSLVSGSVSSIASVSSLEHKSTPMPIITTPASRPSPSTVASKVQPSPALKRDFSPALPIIEAPDLQRPSPPQHPIHYYPSGDVKFLISTSETLYQLHSDVLARQSGWYKTYRNKYTRDGEDVLPQGWVAQPGPFCTVYVHYEKRKIQFERPSAYAIDEATGALILEDITVAEMDACLAVLYPTSVSVRVTPFWELAYRKLNRNFITFGLDMPLEVDTQTNWQNVLRVAHMWDCPAVRELALNRLRSLAMAPFQRLVLAREYGVEGWAETALEDLMVRDDSLSEDEIKQMMAGDVALVTNEREGRARRKMSPVTLSSILPAPPPITEPKFCPSPGSEVPSSPSDPPPSVPDPGLRQFSRCCSCCDPSSSPGQYPQPPPETAPEAPPVTWDEPCAPVPPEEACPPPDSYPWNPEPYGEPCPPC